MILERITEDNIDYAVQIQNELFPEESARQNYEESVSGISGYEYYLVYEDGNCVGVTGIYSYPDDNDNACLDGSASGNSTAESISVHRS